MDCGDGQWPHAVVALSDLVDRNSVAAAGDTKSDALDGETLGHDHDVQDYRNP